MAKPHECDERERTLFPEIGMMEYWNHHMAHCLSRRADTVESLRAAYRLRVGELELAGRYFSDAPKRRPIVERQGQIRRSQDGENRSRSVRKRKLKRAVSQQL